MKSSAVTVTLCGSVAVSVVVKVYNGDTWAHFPQILTAWGTPQQILDGAESFSPAQSPAAWSPSAQRGVGGVWPQVRGELYFPSPGPSPSLARVIHPSFFSAPAPPHPHFVRGLFPPLANNWGTLHCKLPISVIYNCLKSHPQGEVFLISSQTHGTILWADEHE